MVIDHVFGITMDTEDWIIKVGIMCEEYHVRFDRDRFTIRIIRDGMIDVHDTWGDDPKI